MLTIEIGKGYFLFHEDSGKVIRVDFIDCKLPMNPNIGFTNEGAFNKLPDPDCVYEWCQKLRYSPEKTIDSMLAVYHKMRMFRASYLSDKQITVGFIGHRGSGKSASATGVVCLDYLLCPGYHVWSNVPIALKVKYGDAEKVFQSEPLPKLEFLEMDDSFRKGVVFFDEVNMETAESSRYMSTTNLNFSNMLQQMRKRGMSVIWTAQSWNTIDPRLKFQTDYVVWCVDAFFDKKHSAMGWRSKWMVMDCSGLSGVLDFEVSLKSRYLLDFKISEPIFYMRPWWGAYQTEKLQGQDAYSLKELKRLKDPGGEFKAPSPMESKAAQLVKFIEDQGLTKVYCDNVWTENNLKDDRATQTLIGMAFANSNWRKKRDTHGYYWIREIPAGENIEESVVANSPIS